MTPYSAFEYLLIDAANHADMDKELFEVRIDYILNRIDNLWDLVPDAPQKTRPLLVKTIFEIEKARKGIPSGHRIGLDATCSGIQILSAVSGCHAGANATGLIDPNRRADAYTDVTNAMSDILGSAVLVERKEVKDATMTAGYGSKAKPEEIFGEDTPELAAFYEATMKVAPGAAQLLVELKETWIPFALKHSVILPDNFHAHMKVMEDCESVIEVDELDHATFTLYYKENIGKESAVSNVANVTHALDAYLLRSMIRRCNYDPVVARAVQQNLSDRILARACGEEEATLNQGEDDDLMIYLERYDSTGIADAVIFPYLTDYASTAYLTDVHIHGLIDLIGTMLVHEPFPITSVHDEFLCLPGNATHMRQHYANVMADLADSEVLSDIFTQMHGTPIKYQKLSNNLGDLIRKSEYAIS